MKYIEITTIHQFERIKQVKKTFEHTFILNSWSGESTVYERMMETWPYCTLFISNDSEGGLKLESFFYENEEPTKDGGVVGMFSGVDALSENIFVDHNRNFMLFLGEQTAELYSLSNPDDKEITLEDVNVILEQSTIFHENMQVVYTDPEMRRVILDLKVQLEEGKGPQPSIHQN